MKTKPMIFIIVFLPVLAVIGNIYPLAEESTQFGLPEGAIARFGKGSINTLQFSPDGMHLAVGTTIGVWLYELQHAKGTILPLEKVRYFNIIKFSTDSKTIAGCGDYNQDIQLWDTETGRHTLSIKLPQRISKILDMAFAMDNKSLTCLHSNGNITKWDVITGQELSRSKVSYSNSVLSFSQDGIVYVSGHRENGEIRLWMPGSVDDGFVMKPKKRLALANSISNLFGDNQDDKENLNGVYKISISSDNKTIVSAHHDNRVRIWDLTTMSERFSDKGHTEQINALAFSPDNRIIASGSADNRILLWNIQNGKQYKELLGHKSDITALTYSPNKNGLLASGSMDGTIRYWITHTGKEQSIFATGHTNGVKALAFTKDNSMLAKATYQGTVQIWNIETKRQLLSPPVTHHDQTNAIAFSRDATLFASHGLDAEIHSRENNSVGCSSPHKETEVWSIPTGDKLISLSQQAGALAFSPAKKLLAAQTSRHGVRLWDVNTGSELFQFKTGKSFVGDLVFSSNGEFLAARRENGKTHIWNIATQQEIMSPNPIKSYLLAFSPDNTRLAIGNREGIVLYAVNPTNLQEYSTIPFRRITTRGDLIFSPDGKTMIDTKLDLGQNTYQFAIQLWDVETSSDLGTLYGHAGPIETLLFSHDGKTLASGSGDGTVLLWDWEAIITKARKTKEVNR